MSKVVVIGGGAAGMMAAIGAAGCGHRVILLEKNEKLGKKLFITGKGRCNITNHSDVEELLQNVMRNRKFLYSAFYTFDSDAVMELLESEGLRLKTERGNRVFPASDKSSDVIKTLQRTLERLGVQISLHTEVECLEYHGDVCEGVWIKKAGKREKILADNIIIATGGISYASTGSTGDGYEFARQTGHRIEITSPSLVPFNTKEEDVTMMQGLSLKNVTLSVKNGKKTLFEEQGEMLFTHFGVSGPLVLSASSVVSGSAVTGLQGSIDLKPALSREQLDERILRDFKQFQNSLYKNSLQKLLPAKMIPVFIERSGISSEKRVNEITREERLRIVELMKTFSFTIDSLRGYHEAIITRGGISVKDVNPTTMESKIMKHLYFAGEVLDLDAKTGGYNLQIAWSTGYLAGISVK